ncbi:hypothetical protein [Novosphingobium sp. 9]|uniref:hypothetical protein n=1 Tax=Novosphingobium sp. 9 TaxID=2025349 RepID=UPI0021B6E08C|nr:hypothetical protein [Novosphingobium sp. 9]
MTSDGTVTVGGIAAGSTYEYSTDGGATWQAGTGETGTGGASFTLPEGTYSDVQVREVDAAGNPGAPTSLGGVTVDTGAPDAPQAGLVQDTGISDADQITSNGTVAVSGLEAGATFEYSTDGGTTWVAGPAPASRWARARTRTCRFARSMWRAMSARRARWAA